MCLTTTRQTAEADRRAPSKTSRHGSWAQGHSSGEPVDRLGRGRIRARRAVAASLAGMGHRQLEEKVGTPPVRHLKTDDPAHLFNQSLRDRKPEARAPFEACIGGIRLAELREDPRPKLLRDTRSAVAHLHSHAIGSWPAEIHGYGTSAG